MSAAPPPPVFSIGGSGSSSKTTTTKKTTTKSSGGGLAASAQQSYLSQLESAYMGLWGVPAPPGYIERIAASHMNLFEFQAHERAKPAFKNSPSYKEEQLQIQSQLVDRFGANGYQ